MSVSVWTEKYRPKTINDCVLPKRIRTFFQSLIDKNDLQTMLLVGSAGTGKTSAAKALCNDLGIDVLFINASENGQIETIRTQVRQFASTVSFGGRKLKCVIFDECGGLSSFAQDSLKGFIEEFASNCRFIFTTNFTNKIIDPILSRCVIIDFTLTKEEKQECVKEFFKRLVMILEAESIQYEKKDIIEIIFKLFPDCRKIINEMQRNVHLGRLDVYNLLANTDSLIKELVEFIKNCDFTNARKWVSENSDIEFHHLMKMLYKTLLPSITKVSIAELILLLNTYDYRSAFVVDKEINTMAMIVEIMSKIEFVE